MKWNVVTAHEFMDHITVGNQRCRTFETNFLKCAQRTGLRDAAERCQLHFEDYKECLYNVKKNTRIKKMLVERRKQGRAPIDLCPPDVERDTTNMNTERG